VNKVTALTQPVTISTGWQPMGPKVTTHSPTARVVVSTAGAGSLVLTGIAGTTSFWEELLVGGNDAVLTGSWAEAGVVKASAHSNVRDKTQVVLEDF
jgi:hypothetical protein